MQGQQYCTPHAYSEHPLYTCITCFTYNRSAKLEFMPVHSAMVSTYREYLKLLMLYRPPLVTGGQMKKFMIHGRSPMYILNLNSPNKLKRNKAILYYHAEHINILHMYKLVLLHVYLN